MQLSFVCPLPTLDDVVPILAASSIFPIFVAFIIKTLTAE
jgi:hypothetical protein